MLNITMVIALVALTIVWIRITKKPGNLEALIENESSYLALINEDALEQYKAHVESVQPQHREISKLYFLQALASVKTLDSVHALVQQAIAFGAQKDSVSQQVLSTQILLDTLFADFFALQEPFMSDTVGNLSSQNGRYQYYFGQAAEADKLINDFKIELTTHPWSIAPRELQKLMLYDLENRYLYFIISEYDFFVFANFDIIYYSTHDEIPRTKLEMGSLMFAPPREMVLYEKGRIKVQISKRQQQEFMAKAKAEGNIIDSVAVSDIMTVKLMGEDFEIIPIDDEEQGVTEQGYTQWEFDITPKESGTLDLYVKAGIVYAVPGLGMTKKSFPVYERKIEVHASPVKRFASFMTERWEFLISTFLIPVLSWGYSRIRRYGRRTPMRPNKCGPARKDQEDE